MGLHGPSWFIRPYACLLHVLDKSRRVNYTQIEYIVMAGDAAEWINEVSYITRCIWELHKRPISACVHVIYIFMHASICSLLCI